MSIDRQLAIVGMRHWDEVKRSWMDNMTNLGASVARPDPGLDRLSPLQQAQLVERTSMADIDGLRSNALGEAVYLYHKAAHAQLAVARLSMAGMTGWAMFNAYHAALLNAKATMALLGVVFPKIKGKDWIIDIFPVPDKRRQNRQFKLKDPYSTFIGIGISKLDQRYVWQALQRCLTNTMGAWDGVPAVALLKDVNWERVTPPRNRFLYSPPFWPAIEDLTEDLLDNDWGELMTAGLDPEATGFLLSLSLDMYEVASWIFNDLAKESNLFAMQIAGLRWPAAGAELGWGAIPAYSQRNAA